MQANEKTKNGTGRKLLLSLWSLDSLLLSLEKNGCNFGQFRRNCFDASKLETRPLLVLSTQIVGT
jgi:hypothetical protein